MINRAAAKALPAYELIREKVKTSKTNGGDETGMKSTVRKPGFGLFRVKCSRLLLLP
jgi:hypothetical protein